VIAADVTCMNQRSFGQYLLGKASIKKPGVASFFSINALTRQILFTSQCVIRLGFFFLAVAGVLPVSFGGSGGRPPLRLAPILSGQRTSQSAESVRRFVRIGRLLGEIFSFTSPAECHSSNIQIHIAVAAVAPVNRPS
jgi:hypothetical protein